MDRRSLQMVSPAKINLFLAVTGKRPDGYHDLVSLMCPIALADTLKIHPAKDRITVSCEHPQVPSNAANLAHRAAIIFIDHWVKEKNGQPFGLHIDIEKHIPVAAGLGGGSSNAAMVLLAMNQWCGQPYSLKELIPMAVMVGADVPFFIYQQPAMATGIGEKLYPVDRILHGFSIILVHPLIEISTANVYQSLNLRLTKCPQHLKNLNLCVEGDRQWNIADKVEKYLCNDLETVILPRYPEITRIKGILADRGANGALMSGSGPTVFGLFKDKAVAHRAYLYLKDRFPWEIYLSERWSHPKK